MRTSCAVCKCTYKMCSTPLHSQNDGGKMAAAATTFIYIRTPGHESGRCSQTVYRTLILCHKAGRNHHLLPKSMAT